MPEPTSEIIRRALVDAMADPDDCCADEDECLRRHPVHLALSVGDDVQIAYVQVNEVGAIIAAALQSVGRLLPEGGETRTDWGVQLHGYIGADEGGFDEAQARHEAALGGEVIRREIREWSDGSSWIGPWVEVTDA